MRRDEMSWGLSPTSARVIRSVGRSYGRSVGCLLGMAGCVFLFSGLSLSLSDCAGGSLAGSLADLTGWGDFFCCHICLA